jgi:hypothetical protein
VNARRLWAAAALLCAIAALALAVEVAANHFPRGLTVLACLVLAVCAAWWGVLRRGPARVIGIGVAAASIAAAIVFVIV